MMIRQLFHKYTQIVIVLCVASLVFLNPFPHVTAPSEIFFYTALALALLLFISKATRPDISSPLGLPFLCFLLFALASIAWAFDWENTTHDVYRHLLRHIVLYLMLISFFIRKEDLLTLIWSIIASTTLFSLAALIYSYIILASPISFRIKLEGIGSNQIAQYCLLGTILSLCSFPVAKKWYQKTVLMICFVITISAVILSYSRACLLALGAACLFCIFTASKFKKTLIVVSLLILAVSISLFNLSPDYHERARTSTYERIKIYATAYEMIKERPVSGFGYGMKTFKQNFFKFNKLNPQNLVSQIDYAHPHNVFLDITIRLGLVGLVLFCWILFRVFKMGGELICRSRDPFYRHWGIGITACLIAFLTAGLFGNILNNRSSVILYTIIAMITILWKLNQYPVSDPNR